MLKELSSQIRNWRQIYLLVFLISAMASLVSAVVFFTYEVNTEYEIIKKERADIEQLADLMSPLIQGFDLKSIKAIGEGLSANRTFTRIEFLGEKDYILYRYIDETTASRSDVIEILQPIYSQDTTGPPRRIGTLIVNILNFDTYRLAVEALKSALKTFIIAFLVSLPATIFYAQKTIKRPLRQLQDAIEQTLTSGRPVQTKYTGTGFIGTFQNQFNRMQSRLLESQNSLHEKSADLELNSDLMREVLRSVHQSVRLYTPTGYTDFGDAVATFQPPERPLNTQSEFIDYLKNTISFNDSHKIHHTLDDQQDTSIQYEFDIAISETRWLNIKYVLLSKASSALFVTDISTSKKFEKSLQHAQKMKVIATLTSGIAHDFNNILAIISGNLELILYNANNPHDVTKNAEHGLNASRRGAAIVTSLLAFDQPHLSGPI